MTNTYINIYSAGGSSADSHAAELVGGALAPSPLVQSGEEAQAYSNGPPAPALDAVSSPDLSSMGDADVPAPMGLAEFDTGDDQAPPPASEAYESALLKESPAPDEASQRMDMEAPAPTGGSNLDLDDDSVHAAPAPDDNIGAELAPKRGAKKKSKLQKKS